MYKCKHTSYTVHIMLFKSSLNVLFLLAIKFNDGQSFITCVGVLSIIVDTYQTSFSFNFIEDESIIILRLVTNSVITQKSVINSTVSVSPDGVLPPTIINWLSGRTTAKHLLLGVAMWFITSQESWAGSYM